MFTLSLWTLFYLVLTWTVWVTGGAIATSVIAQERLLTSSIDSQLSPEGKVEMFRTELVVAVLF